MCFRKTPLRNSEKNHELFHLKPSATVIKKIHFHGQGFPRQHPTHKLPLHLLRDPQIPRLQGCHPVLCSSQTCEVGAATILQGRLCRVSSAPPPLRFCPLEAPMPPYSPLATGSALSWG